MTITKKTINKPINKNAALIKLLGISGIKQLADQNKCSDRTVRRAINKETDNLTILEAAVKLGEVIKSKKVELNKKIKALK